MKNPFGEVHKKELVGWYLVVDTDDIAIIHEPFCESEADFLVAAINGFEATEKEIAGQQAEIERLNKTHRVIICEFCGDYQEYNETNREEVARQMREHYKSCQKNPLVKQIAAQQEGIALMKAGLEDATNAIEARDKKIADQKVLIDQLQKENIELRAKIET